MKNRNGLGVTSQKAVALVQKRPAHRRGTLTRKIILDTASEQFQRKGYDRTSLDDVAAALSVTKPTLYYHFASKEDILLGCVTEACDQIDAVLAEKDDSNPPGRQRLEIFLRLYLDVITDNFGISLVLSDDRVMSESGRLEYHRRRRLISRHVTGLVKAGIDDGSITVPDVRLASYAIFGMFNSVARWKSQKPDISVDDIHTYFCAMLFGGIAAKTSSKQDQRKKGHKHG